MRWRHTVALPAALIAALLLAPMARAGSAGAQPSGHAAWLNVLTEFLEGNWARWGSLIAAPGAISAASEDEPDGSPGDQEPQVEPQAEGGPEWNPDGLNVSTEGGPGWNPDGSS